MVTPRSVATSRVSHSVMLHFAMSKIVDQKDDSCVMVNGEGVRIICIFITGQRPKLVSAPEQRWNSF